ncbi:MAG: class I SAM-dependent methyltransferase [Candidatus Eremiobacteraeota bacterium]|nr:class I SAM-dependent methyltransferase [Candidatus Eremiobacteraeota bacterium]
MRTDDVAFYADCAMHARGPVLELGCGTGRILIASAAAGATVAGLDLSPLMLDACRRKIAKLPAEIAKRIELVEDDMRSFKLGRRFALITIPFRAFCHLINVDDQLACLRRVREHLDDEGELVFDVFQPRLDMLIDPRAGDEVEDTPESALGDGRTVRRTARRAKIRQAEQTMQVEFNYYIKSANGQVERLTESFPFRYYFRYELEHLLARAGLRVAALYGWYDRSPVSEQPRDLIFTARRA